MWYVSVVTCQVSGVRCHVSLTHVIIKKEEKKKKKLYFWTKLLSQLVEGLLSMWPTQSSFNSNYPKLKNPTVNGYFGHLWPNCLYLSLVRFSLTLPLGPLSLSVCLSVCTNRFNAGVDLGSSRRNKNKPHASLE